MGVKKSSGSIKVTGSNFEGTSGQAVPSKAIHIGGISATGNLTTPYVFAPADGQLAVNGMITWSPSMGYNGSTLDRWRNNTEGTLLASAARTASVTSPDQTNYNAKGILLFLNITAASGSGGLQVYVQAKDPVSGSYVYLTGVPTAITATGLYVYELGRGVGSTALSGNQQVNKRNEGQIPRIWRGVVNHGDGSSYTYSLGYALIV